MRIGSRAGDNNELAHAGAAVRALVDTLSISYPKKCFLGDKTNWPSPFCAASESYRPGSRLIYLLAGRVSFLLVCACWPSANLCARLRWCAHPEPPGAERGAVENLIKSIQRRTRYHFSIASVRHHFLGTLNVGVSEKSTENVFLGNYWHAKLPLLLSLGAALFWFSSNKRVQAQTRSRSFDIWFSLLFLIYSFPFLTTSNYWFSCSR